MDATGTRRASQAPGFSPDQQCHLDACRSSAEIGWVWLLCCVLPSVGVSLGRYILVHTENLRIKDTCTTCHTIRTSINKLTTVEPLNKGHFGDNINSADLFFVERFSSLGSSKCLVGIVLGL